jgi:hypothetical protein
VARPEGAAGPTSPSPELGAVFGCPAGTQISVATTDLLGNLVNNDFMINVN